jgi:TPR repeat protein
VPQSTPDAVRWFIRAARQGDKTAQHNLGVHYSSLELPDEESLAASAAAAALVAAAAEAGEDIDSDSEELPR